MKISKAALAGLLALSMMSIAACGTKQTNNNSDSSAATSSVSSADTISDDAESTEENKSAADSKTTSNISSTSDKTTESKTTANTSFTSAKTTESTTSTDSDNFDGVNKGPNEYGLYLLTTTAPEGISVEQLQGSWRDNGIGTEIITVTPGSMIEKDIYSGSFSYKNDEGKVIHGDVTVQYMIGQDDITYVYAFYSEDGSLLNAFYAFGDTPVTELVSCVGKENFSLEDRDEVYKNEISLEGYAGTYYEQTAGRGSITFSVDASLYGYFHVKWSSSANETAEWDFSGAFKDDIGGIPYTNGIKNIYKYDENGNETVEEVYSNGTGTIIFEHRSDDSFALYWYDDMENIADGCVFVRQ